MVLAVRGQTFEDDIGRWLHGEQLSKQSVFHSGETVFFTEDKYSKYSDIKSHVPRSERPLECNSFFGA